MEIFTSHCKIVVIFNDFIPEISHFFCYRNSLAHPILHSCPRYLEKSIFLSSTVWHNMCEINRKWKYTYLSEDHGHIQCSHYRNFTFFRYRNSLAHPILQHCSKNLEKSRLLSFTEWHKMCELNRKWK